MTRLRYAGSPHRYAPEEIRYAGLGFRYATTRLRYAAARFRYARTPPRYAAVSVRYAGRRFGCAAAGFRVKFARPRADATVMLRPSQPMSNTERQRRFRQSHPGYYARVNARRRAASRPATAALVNLMAEAQAAGAGELPEIPGVNVIPAAA